MVPFNTRVYQPRTRNTLPANQHGELTSTLSLQLEFRLPRIPKRFGTESSVMLVYSALETTVSGRREGEIVVMDGRQSTPQPD